MGKYIEGQDRNQLMLFPISIDEMIAEDNPVRGLDLIADELDVPSLGFTHSTTKATGRPPYNPVVMFKIYLYCYYNRIRSSRAIERECNRNIELIWLSGGIAPDHKSIAEFRKNNKEAIKEGHRAFIRMCDSLGLIGKELAAVDGSKFRADNSRKSNITLSKIGKMITHFEETIQEYLKALAENDVQEYSQKAKIKKAQKKIAELKQIEEEMKAAGISEMSLTDPDSHLMGVANKGCEVSYNVQAVVDDKHHIITTTDVATSPADQTQLYHMADKTATELVIKESIVILADKGYWRGEDLQKCEQDERVTVIVSPTEEKGCAGFKKSEFQYDKETNSYICPQGAVLHRTGAKQQTYVNEKACKSCSCREKCTKRKRGRIITRNEYEEIFETIAERYKANFGLYKKRQQLVEHPFGTIKRGLGFTYFLTRGLENVKTENTLHVMTYNLKRVMNIFSPLDLMTQFAQMRKEQEKETPCILRFFAVLGKFKAQIGKLYQFEPAIQGAC